MGTRSTMNGYLRQQGATNASSSKLVGAPVISVSMLMTPIITFDPTLVNTTGLGVYLPAGAVPLFAKITNAGATGGIAPTVDVGLAGGNVDGLIAEGDADTPSSAILTSGTSLDAPLAADTEITGGVGASAATGGTVSCRVFYAMDDAGDRQN